MQVWVLEVQRAVGTPSSEAGITYVTSRVERQLAQVQNILRFVPSAWKGLARCDLTVPPLDTADTSVLAKYA